MDRSLLERTHTNVHTVAVRHTLIKVTIICRYIFSGFGILCILLVLNFAWAGQVNDIHDGLFAIFSFYKY